MAFSVAILVVLLLCAAIIGWVLLTRSQWIPVRDNSGATPRTLEFTPADRFPHDGLSHLRGYIDRLVQSNGHAATVTIFTPDGMHGFGLIKFDGVISASITVEWREESDREARIREFFHERGIEPLEDYLSGSSEVPDSTRIFRWPIQGDAEGVTDLSRSIALDLCGIEDSSALNLKFEAREKPPTNRSDRYKITMPASEVLRNTPSVGSNPDG